MFKRQNRLPGGSRFNSSKSFTVAFFVLKVKENNLGLNRFGIVVSKKIDKRAVVRNRIKRMLREIILNINSEMTSGHDMLFIVRKMIQNAERDNIYFLIRKTLEQAKYIK